MRQLGDNFSTLTAPFVIVLGKEGKAGEVFESEQFDNPVHGQKEGEA